MPTPKLSAPRGFNDILPPASAQWQFVEQIARDTAALYHFAEIRTPVLEDTALFHRGVGETSDVVRKETYTFTDRDGESLTLRPEGTAGVVRAVIEAGFLNDQGARAKVYYLTSNFRHERPQKGRLRQHHQFGAEAFGIAEPEQDVECIQLQMDFYARCGVKDLALRINSLGDRESKEHYRGAIVAFLSPKFEQLSDESKRRLTNNPLRILDSKDSRDIAALATYKPDRQFCLSDRSLAHFNKVCDLLDKFQIPFQIDETLVRGFDYYTETLWEVAAAGLGSQNAIGGGGRYDNLVESLGGRPTPGVGFGSGLERLLIALEAQGVNLPLATKPLIYLISQNQQANESNIALLRTLRQAGFSADMDLSNRSMKAQFKLADREKAEIVLIVGETELAADTLALKQLATGHQQTVPRADLISTLGRLLDLRK